MSRKQKKEKTLKSGDSRVFDRFLCRKSWILALGELGSATCGLQTVLLSLLHSGITGHEASSLQGSAVLGIQGDQSAGNAVTDSAGLTGNAAACDGDNDINLANQVGGDQGLTNDQLQGLQTEVIVDVAAIDDDGTGAVLVNANTGNGGLTTAGAVKILLLALVHSKLPPNYRVQASGF